MNNPDPFQIIFPALLENSIREVGDLIGETLELREEISSHGSLRDVFPAPKKKFGVVVFDVKGGEEAPARLVFDVDLAIDLGGRLIMLPGDEIVARKKQGDLDGELLDAFSEISNILSGVMTTAFQDFPKKKIHFVKGKIDLFPPRADAVPAQDGNLTSFSGSVALQDKKLGFFQFLFPHSLLEEPKVIAETPKEEEGETDAKRVEKRKAGEDPGIVPEKGDAHGQSQETVPGRIADTPPDAGGGKNRKTTISIIGEDPSQFGIVEESITGEDVQLTRFSLESDFKQSLIRENPCCVFLLINKVNDQGLAKTIKVRAALKKDCPLIVAGPEWTRAMVLKARKYGATDILITPADIDSIRKKYRKYL